MVQALSSLPAHRVGAESQHSSHRERGKCSGKGGKGHQVLDWEVPVAGSVWGLGEH